MEQHIKTRLAVSLAVVLLICLGPTFVLSQSAVHRMPCGRCLSAESKGAQAGDPQQIVSFTSFNEWHEGTRIEAAVTRQNPDFKYRGRFVNSGAVRPTRYMIVVTGGELLSGVYADGHTYFITRTLRPLGLQCVGSMSVDDKQADLKEALRYATDKAALVIVTGGLGPTENDITRETLSDFTGVTLKEHPEVLQNMARRFHVSPAQVRSNLRRQTQVPTQGTSKIPTARPSASFSKWPTP